MRRDAYLGKRLHRWEYQHDRRVYECIDAGIGGVDSGQWCWPGCRATISSRDLQASGLEIDSQTTLHVALDVLVRGKYAEVSLQT